MIRLSRQSIYYDKLRNYKIYIDDIYYGNIGNGEVKEIDTGAGQHTIYLKIDWCRSNKLTFKENDNEVMELQCGNSMGEFTRPFMRVFMLIYMIAYISFLKNKYLFIKFKEDI